LTSHTFLKNCGARYVDTQATFVQRPQFSYSRRANYSGEPAAIISRVVARLVPATSIVPAPRSNARGRRDKPGDDSRM